MSVKADHQNLCTPRQHFSNAEVEFLKESVLRYKKIVENRKNGALDLKVKEAAWRQIVQDFNAIASHTPRTVKQLKKKWENIKTRRKSDIAIRKREIMETGDGPRIPKRKDDPDLDGVLDVTSEIPNVVDSDYLSTEDGETANYDNELNADDDQVVLVSVEDAEVPSSSITEQFAKPSSGFASGSLIFNKKTPHTPSRGFSKLNSNLAVRSKVYARVSRVKKQMTHDDELHALLKQDLECKLETSKLEYQLKFEEYNHKKRMWDLEYETARKKAIF